MIIAPSLLAANWKNIDQEIEKIKHPHVKWIHFDVMDGKFVPNITYTPKQLKAISKKHNYFWDVHLMVNNPIKEVKKYADAGANLLTFHYEATNNHHQVIEEIKKLNCKVGISIKPNTKVNLLKPLIKEIDVVLVMSVEPGKGGQSFIASSLDKIKTLKEWKQDHNFLIEVDGGIKDYNASEVFQAGADVLVAGSFIFGSKNYFNQINKLVK